ncbi:MAG: HNH endonuclease [Candidatus Paceibacterota bacterium]|jgi:hypothetical protein
MEDAICGFCCKKFKRKKSQLKLSEKHYCSIVCQKEGRKKGKTVKCFMCNKFIYKSLKDLKNSKSKKYFCSQICSNKWIGIKQRDKNHPNWKGGGSSYKNLLKRTKTKPVCISCGKDDIRILCVHHLNKNRKNNDIKNLAWLCRNCHFLVHNYSKKL